MNTCPLFFAGLLGLALLGGPAAAQDAPAAAAASASSAAAEAQARAGWAFFAGRFAIEAPPAANLPACKVWNLSPVLGGKYLELLDHAYQADFRMTLAWDKLRKRYAMSLLDSGSGVLDGYTGALQNGAFVLTNDHGFRVRIQAQPDGWLWQYEYSKDGNWLPLEPPVRGRRV